MRELFSDYEPDYDALWQEYVELDEQAAFYATHEQEDYLMTEDHKPLPVSGYTPQSDAKVALVNEFKQDEERLLRKVDALFPNGVQFGGERHDQDNQREQQRWRAIAKTHFQEGFMALNRAVFQPRRISLPEDDGNPPGRQTSPELASLAGRLMDHEDPEVRRLAASALGQVNE